MVVCTFRKLSADPVRSCLGKSRNILKVFERKVRKDCVTPGVIIRKREVPAEGGLRVFVCMTRNVASVMQDKLADAETSFNLSLNVLANSRRLHV